MGFVAGGISLDGSGLGVVSLGGAGFVVVVVDDDSGFGFFSSSSVMSSLKEQT